MNGPITTISFSLWNRIQFKQGNERKGGNGRKIKPRREEGRGSIKKAGGFANKRAVLPRKQPQSASLLTAPPPFPLQRNGTERDFLFASRSRPARRPRPFQTALFAPRVIVLYITPILSSLRTRPRTHALTSLSLFAKAGTRKERDCSWLATKKRRLASYEDEARRLLLLPRGRGAAPPEEAPDDCPRGHVRAAARRPGGVDTRRRRGVRRLAGRPCRRHAHVRGVASFWLGFAWDSDSLTE
jgi:hypothetical protein